MSTTSERPLDPSLPPVGTLLDGKYRVESYIGVGAMGAVAKAKHLARDADVALKFLTAAPVAGEGNVRDRFRLEAIAASRLHTDHVVRVFDVAESATGVPYLVMELLEGEDLDKILVRDGAMPVPRAVHIVLQALRALDVAHAAGVVHRDLKPGNLFVLPRDGDDDFVKIVDFGISKVEESAASPRLTQGETVMGTPLYMAPEQASDARHVTAAADIYSAAAVLYECIAGTPPLVADRGIEMLYKLMQVTPERLDDRVPIVPGGLADAVARALAKKPEDRPQSAAAFAELLAPYADERSTRVLLALRLSPRTPSVFPQAEGASSLVPSSGRKERPLPRTSPELDALLLRKSTPGRGTPAPKLGEIDPPTDRRPEASTREAVDLRRLVGEYVPATERPSSRPRVSRPPKPALASWAAVALLSFTVVFILGLAILQVTGLFRASARQASPAETKAALNLATR